MCIFNWNIESAKKKKEGRKKTQQIPNVNETRKKKKCTERKLDNT